MDVLAIAAGVLPALAGALVLASASGAAGRALACAACGAAAFAAASLVECAFAAAVPGWPWNAVAAGTVEPAAICLVAACAGGRGDGWALACMGACSALGFAGAEGAVYAAAGGMGTAAARAVASVPAHAADGAIAGLVAAWAAARRPDGGGMALPWACGWLAAAASHSAFDALALSGAPWGGDAAAALGWCACAAAAFACRRAGARRRCASPGRGPSDEAA